MQTCETCKHWKQTGSTGILDANGYRRLWKTGECAKLQDGGDCLFTVLNISDEDDRPVLDIDSRFGCILHEPK